MATPGKANGYCVVYLLQFLVCTYMLDHALALECHLCIYWAGHGSTCNCNETPEKFCTGGLPPGTYARMAQQMLKPKIASNNHQARSVSDKFCAMVAGFADGQRVIMRTRALNNESANIPAQCDLVNLNEKQTTPDGHALTIKKACVCDTDYCNGIYFDVSTLSTSSKHFPWSSISLTLLATVSTYTQFKNNQYLP